MHRFFIPFFFSDSDVVDDDDDDDDDDADGADECNFDVFSFSLIRTLFVQVDANV